MDWAHQKQFFASCSLDKSIKISSFNEMEFEIQEKCTLRDHQGLIRTVKISEDDNFLFSGGFDKRIFLYDIERE